MIETVLPNGMIRQTYSDGTQWDLFPQAWVKDSNGYVDSRSTIESFRFYIMDLSKSDYISELKEEL